MLKHSLAYPQQIHLAAYTGREDGEPHEGGASVWRAVSPPRYPVRRLHLHASTQRDSGSQARRLRRAGPQGSVAGAHSNALYRIGRLGVAR